MSDYQELLAQLQREEDTLQFDAFTNEIAFSLGTKLVQVALQGGLSVTVDICRSGQQLFHCALTGTSADNDAWIKRKNRVVNRFGHSSYHIGIKLKSQDASLDSKYLLDPRKYAAHGGAFPVIVRNVGVIGTVTVSGLAQEDDHRLVVRVLKEYLAAD